MQSEEKCSCPPISYDFLDYMLQKVAENRISRNRVRLILLIPITSRRSHVVYGNLSPKTLRDGLTNQVQRISRNPFDNANEFVEDRKLRKRHPDQLIRRGDIARRVLTLIMFENENS